VHHAYRDLVVDVPLEFGPDASATIAWLG